MEQQKQIEAMARIICKPTANKGNCERCGFRKQCSKFDDARVLYNAGFRQQSEVAKEIIAYLKQFEGYADIAAEELEKKYVKEQEA